MDLIWGMKNEKDGMNGNNVNNGSNESHGLKGQYGPVPTMKELEQLRQKYAGMAMQAIISNSKYYKECERLSDEENSGFTDFSEVVAFEAVHFADRLIEALYPEQIDNIVED